MKAETPAMNGVLEAALYVDDLDAAAGFYGGVLGLEQVIRHDPRHVFFRCGTTIVLLFRADQTRIPPGEGALPVPPGPHAGETADSWATTMCVLSPETGLPLLADKVPGAQAAIIGGYPPKLPIASAALSTTK